MVAGLFGPTGWRQPPPPAPTSTVRLEAMGNPTSADDGGERSDGSEAEGDSVRYRDGPLVHDPAYRQLFWQRFCGGICATHVLSGCEAERAPVW